MENFDWRKMSKLTFPPGVNETEYLRFEANGTWTASDKEQVCTMTNSNPAKGTQAPETLDRNSDTGEAQRESAGGHSSKIAGGQRCRLCALGYSV